MPYTDSFVWFDNFLTIVNLVLTFVDVVFCVGVLYGRFITRCWLRWVWPVVRPHLERFALFFFSKIWVPWSLVVNIIFYFEKLFVIEAFNMTIVFLIFYKVPSLMDYIPPKR